MYCINKGMEELRSCFWSMSMVVHYWSLISIIVVESDIEREVFCCKKIMYSRSSVGCEDQPYS
jgi:hypothetical protein